VSDCGDGDAGEDEAGAKMKQFFWKKVKREIFLKFLTIDFPVPTNGNYNVNL
jgi:hypothetical protein